MAGLLRRVPWAAVLLLLLLGFSLFQGGSRVAGDSSPVPNCSSTPFTTPGEFTCSLPEYASSVTITAIGGHGGGAAGGVADKVQATFSIDPGGFFSPGDQIYIEVGGNGSAGSGQAGGAGGANGGGAGGNGAPPVQGGVPGLGGSGGGGASDVRTCSISTPSCRPPLTAANDTRVLVAGGGGGVGGGFGSPDGGAGGAAGRPGAGSVISQAQPGTMSGGGDGGAKGAPQGGHNGGRGAGGAGGAYNEGGGGGGGGGGYYGGGGGSAGVIPAVFPVPGQGGGGAGGADFVKPGGTAVTEAPSDAPPSVTVTFPNHIATNVNLSSSANPSEAGEAVKFTAVVSCAGINPDGGVVTFFDGTDAFATVTLRLTRTAVATASSLEPGTHTITATYGVGTNHDCLPSTSAPLQQVVNPPGPSTLEVYSSANPSIIGHVVIFTAFLECPSSPDRPSTGIVTFKDGAKTLGTANLTEEGVAEFETPTLKQGTHSITASYPGQLTCPAVTSAPLQQVVNLPGL